MSLEALDPLPSPARVPRRSARWGRSLATLAVLAGLALIASALFAAPEVARPTASVVLETPSAPRAPLEAGEAESEAVDGDGPSYDWGDDFGQVGEGARLARSPRSGHVASLPLEHTDVYVDVRGLVATATVTQRFRNPGARPIEAVYVFPLPADAAVYDIEARVGTRLIKSAVKERQQARAVYEQARASGRRAALLEQERPNIFTTALANVLPGERVEVRLRYGNVLPWEGGRARLTFPLVVGTALHPGRVRVAG